MKQKIIIFLGLIALVITGCSSEIPIVKYLDLKSPLTLIIATNNKQTGVTNSSREIIEPGSEKFNNFVSWCNNNLSDWQNSPASYIGKVIVAQNDFRLLYNQDFVIISFIENNGKIHQYTKSVKKGELDFLVEKVNN
jgi:hypothetical protein